MPIKSLSFEMRRPSHAIAEFTAVLKFPRAVSAETFSRVKVKLETEARRLELPVPMRQQGFQMEVGPNGAMPAVAIPEGFGFQRFAPDGEISHVLLAEHDGLTITIRDYAGWEQVCPMLIETFANLALDYLKETPVLKAIALSYLNEFKAKDAGAVSANEVLREDSKWVASFAREAESAWHCHTGVFENINKISRTLIAINLDLVANRRAADKSVFNFLKCGINVGKNFDLPGKVGMPVLPGDISGVLAENLTELHSREREVLAEILSQPYLELVGAS